MGIYKYYEKASPTGKVLIIGAGIAAGVAAWFGIVNPLRKLIVNKLDQSKAVKESKEAKDELKSLEKDGVRPTISNAQAQTFTNSLVSAFEGCGTDEDAVYGIMSQMKNDADVYLLISTFGTRKYDGCNWSGDFGDTEKTLSGAISSELDSFEKSKVNEALRNNGCTFQFT